MIFKYVFNTVLFIRNASLNFPMNCSLKKNKWKEFKSFHLSLVPLCSNKNYASKKTTSKKMSAQSAYSREVKMWKNMTVEDIAKSMNVSLCDLGLLLPQLNLKPNSIIEDFGIFFSVAKKLKMKVKIVKNPNEKAQAKKIKKDIHLRQCDSKPENLIKRPPVVTVMGHVDHGKTTLLDALRNTFVAQQEFGGITQHIGAFSVEVKPGERITFIDTPGHAAFSSMRSRGAQVTDIVVLVIAADDGIMKQTVESMRIANAAHVRTIIAVNKIDKVNALAIEEIKQNLLLEGIQVEDKGGEVQLVPISALKKINLDLLTEVILLEAAALDLKADPTGLVEGVIVESKKEKIGIVATLIVKKGTLKKQKYIVAGKARARVRRMLDENGKDYEEALPSTPVQVFGWKDIPIAGDKVFEVKSEKEASIIVQERIRKSLMEKQEIDKTVIEERAKEEQRKLLEYKKTLQSLKTLKERRKFCFESHQSSENPEVDSTPHLKIILKGDVFGTVEVLLKILQSYDKNEECKLSVVDASVGYITQNDLETAEFFGAIIYAFNVNLLDTAKDFLKDKVIDIRYHNVIYKIINDLKEELNARILPVDEEKINGEAEVLKNFIVTYASKKVPVAGALCIKGQLEKDSLYKVVRNDEVIYEGKVTVMKNEKKIVKTISKGMECGLLLNSFPDQFKPGDRIICYDLIKVSKKSTWDPGF